MGSDPDPYDPFADDFATWRISDGGASCSDTCIAHGGYCPEPCFDHVDTQSEMDAVMSYLGFTCNSGEDYGFSDFPKIDTRSMQCSYKRAWTYAPTCGWTTSSFRARLCPCGSIWTIGGYGESCTQACQDLPGNKACNESALQNCNSPETVKAIASSISQPCNEMYPLWASQFPSMRNNGQCEFTYGYTTRKCNVSTSTFEARPCPCAPVSAAGDPHLVNTNGDKFDILREGISTLLVFPPLVNVSGQDIGRLRVDASIEHPSNGTKCRGWFILHLWIRGSLLQEDIQVSTGGFDLKDPEALEIKLGRNTLRTAKEIDDFVTNGRYNLTFVDKRPSLGGKQNKRVKFANLTLGVAGMEFEIVWATGRKTPNSLDFRASHLGKLGTEWGGMLAGDDHTFVSESDPNCDSTERSRADVQLLAEELDAPWTASASLD